MYLAHIIFMLGVVLTLRSWVALVILVLRAIWFHRRVVADEARLEARFGPEYADYKQRVKRWLPGVL
jgi:protein-S-isoprenylcysteine O-methyltransferase Ste14